MEGYDIFVPELKIDSKYSVSGAECQVLSIALKPGEHVQSEPGAMMVSLVIASVCFDWLLREGIDWLVGLLSGQEVRLLS